MMETMKLVFWTVLGAILFCGFQSLGLAQGSSTNAMASMPEKVVMVPIKEALAKEDLFLIRNGVDRANKLGANALILQLDCPGGNAGAAKEMVKALAEANCPVITWVTGEALGSAAMLAMCTDAVYMEASAVIGEANRDPDITNMTAFARAYSGARGHDPDIVAAMIDPSISLRLPEIPGSSKTVEVSPAGQVLSLNHIQASRQFLFQNGTVRKGLVSEQTVSGLPDILAAQGMPQAQLVPMKILWAHKLAKVITTIAPFLMILSLMLFKQEAASPGFGVFGLLGIICLALLFFGHRVAGLAGYEEIILLVLGVVFIGLEVFVIPGFGFAGIIGLILILASFFMTMVRYLPRSATIAAANPGSGGSLMGRFGSNLANLDSAILNMSIALLGITVVTAMFASLLPKSRFAKRLALEEATSSAAGYTGSSDQALAAGQHGVTVSQLRPAGNAEFDGTLYDVFTEGEYVEPGTSIRVLSSKGNRIIVEAIPPS